MKKKKICYSSFCIYLFRVSLFCSFLFCGFLFNLPKIFAQENVQNNRQLCYLTNDEAKKAVEFLKKETDILVYCDCNGQGDLGRRIKITNVYASPTEREGFFSVMVEGSVVATFKLKMQQVVNYTRDITPITKPEMIDLAFVHIRGTGYENEKKETVYDTLSLGIYLGFVCDPCVEPFNYPTEMP